MIARTRLQAGIPTSISFATISGVVQVSCSSASVLFKLRSFDVPAPAIELNNLVRGPFQRGEERRQKGALPLPGCTPEIQSLQTVEVPVHSELATDLHSAAECPSLNRRKPPLLNVITPPA
jgi:hypothetical protein